MDRRAWEQSLLPCDEAFGTWLAGFTDGEGCFNIAPTPKGGYNCSFTIKLRGDDAPLLEEICRELGVGAVKHGVHCSPGINGKPWASWRVWDKSGLVFLTEVFDVFPLRSRKADLYTLWRGAVIHWANSERPVDWTPIARAHEQLRVLREYVGVFA